MQEFFAVGKGMLNVDGLKKITGKAQFCVDLVLPRMLYGKILRSPYPHAKIVSIDTSKAERLSGVKAVLTGKDCPEHRYGIVLWDEHVLAKQKVRYIGDSVAAVAAETEWVAEEALDLIKVDYEELPAVFDPEESMETAPLSIIHEDLPKYGATILIPQPKLDAERPNVFSYFKIQRGDVERGFGESDLIMENKFTTAMIQHCQMEPHNAIAQWDDGKLVVWSSTQGPYSTQTLLCNSLGIASFQVRVIVPYVGGGYGGKGLEAKIEPICALLSKKTGRPVKITFTRKEMFMGATVRHPMAIYIKDGAKKDGRIKARQMKIVLNAGAYSGISSIVVRNTSFGPVGSYKMPNFKLDSYAVYTNLPIAGAFRGFGSPQALWAVESHMDMIAKKLGLDPVEIRMKNLMDEGDENVIGERMHSIGAKECLRKATEAIGWKEKMDKEREGWKRGRGVAAGNKYSVAPSSSCAYVKVHPDGIIEIRTAAIDLGQGSNTILSQIAAEEFRIPLEKVKIIWGDTEITPYDFGSYSSRQTYNSGNAVKLACADAKGQLFERAANRLEARPDDLETRDGSIYVRGVPGKEVRIRDLFSPSLVGGLFLDEGGEIIGKSTFYQRADFPDPETGLIPKDGPVGRTTAFYIHAAQTAEVEVNVRTGQIRVIKFASALDVGKAINPLNVEGQIEGGIGMGIGSALHEEMILEKGLVVNPTFMDYKILTAKELPFNPMTSSIIVEAPHDEGPFGAKGIGEGVLVASAPAIANAIYDAVGVRIKELPITTEKVLRALKDKKAV